MRIATGCLTVAWPLLLLTGPLRGQGVVHTRSGIRPNPPGGAMLGQAVTLAVQPTASGAAYRFVATMLTTGAGLPAGRLCSRSITIGTGASVTWTPASGTYRLKAHEVTHTSAMDTLVAEYEVRAPDTGVTAAYTPPQPPPGGTTMATLIVSTSDLGPGHRYRFSVRFGNPPSSPGGQPPPAVPAPWSFESDRASLAFPLPVSSTIPAFATVTVHRGDQCQIVAVGSSPNLHASR